MTNEFKGQLTPLNAKNYILAGNATITLRSTKTDKRFTYKIRSSNDGRVHWVKVLQGPNNEEDFGYIGTIFDEQTFSRTKKSQVGKTSPCFVAFTWVWNQLNTGKDPANLEIWHEGSCGRCGRKLTVPESIEKGIGPVCESKIVN